jgi:hypothetical protein
MNKKEIEKLQKQIQQVKKHLAEIEDLRPGSLSTQYNVCGNPTCRCKRTDNPLKHGPYYQLSYTRKGRHTTEFVKAEDVQEVQLQLQNYQLLKNLIDEWVDLSLTIARLRRGK